MNSFVKITYLYNKIILSKVIILLYITAYARRFQLFKIYNYISDTRGNDEFLVIVIEIIFKYFYLKCYP
jgi:hypothetical protein